jgi:predicted extracellular nuclease
MRRVPSRRLRATTIAALALLAVRTASASASGVVISQVYGGNGATYDADYVELLNAGTSPVSISGWSVQYASATGTGTFASNGPTLLAGTLQPGQYWLVQLASAATGAALPAPDATGTTNISSSAGKLILASTSTGLACNGGSTPCTPDQAAQIVDLVGYGGANFFEGTAAPGLTSTTALLRGAAGCADTDTNGTDFTAGTPAPRNSATPPATCSGGGGGGGGGPLPLAIYTIQGNGAASAYVGQLVSTQGVVTRVNNNGFFLQDPAGDNDPTTSDAIFAYTGSAPTVQAGQLVALTATVAEFNTGAASNTDTASHTVTELTGVTGIQLLGTGYSITPTVVPLPLASKDAMERYEAMLVTLQGPFTVQQNYFLGRYGELTLAIGGRLQTPTNLYRPGPDAQAVDADNVRRAILLDDGSSLQNPNPTPYLAADDTVRAGDTVPTLTGVIDYGLTTSSSTDPGAYKLHPTIPPVFTRANKRTKAAPKVGGNVKVAGANMENFFTTLNDGTNVCPPSNTASDCRGANSAAEFERQRTKLVEELVGLDADAVALMELQNNGATAIQNLVDALNARLGGGFYAAVVDAPTGPGTDAIKVGIIYKTAKLKPIGAARSDPAAVNNRAPLAQTFKVINTGERFNLIANHLKSKGCDSATGLDLDQGDLQGCWNNRRVQQADELRAFAASVQSTSGVADTLLMGDFNAYAQEDPIADLSSSGWADQIARYNTFGYSYVFNGTSGRLDHALASASLSAKVTGAVEWHINADEPSVIDYNLEFKQPACLACGPDDYTPTPYRASDHDPVLVGLSLKKKGAADAPDPSR